MLYSDVEANSVVLVADDNTTSTVLPTRRGGHEKTYGMQDRRRNVYVSLEVWMLWLGFLTSITIVHRARSLRNLLVSGNECGRVFPAGVGPGSPSRDAANWLPSRFSLSVETRRRYGWLRMMVFPGARFFPSPNLVPFGRVAARERQGALSRRAW